MSSARFSFCCIGAVTFAVLLGCSGMQTGVQTARISIPPGMRAVSVRANMAAGVVPGSRVDVLVNDNPVGSESHTTTVLQGVEVLASVQEKPESLGVVTLLTSPKDAEEIMLASQKGRISLILRN
jgi:pilus assembly protein CpaB